MNSNTRSFKNGSGQKKRNIERRNKREEFEPEHDNSADLIVNNNAGSSAPVPDVVQKNVETISSDEEDDQEPSVVNASLIVNLSNANASVVENIEGGEEDVSTSEESTLADSEVEKLMASNHLFQLPSTVTVLNAPNGVVVYLVGTAHFSQQSQVDVVDTIEKTQPTLVMLELCSSRRNILSLDEETVLKEVSEMSFQKVRLALSNSGTVQGTLHLLLLSMSAQLTRKLGMAPGGEFRAAMREARKIPGCVLLLGDRPFNITISRALAALTFMQKIKLAWQFLTCNEEITKEEIEKCKEKDLLERMLSEMTGEFPSITQVFVHERDVYLAHSLYLAATSDAHRNNGGPVVGVVGMGHVPGIVRNWGCTTDDMVNQLITIPETPLSTILIRKSVKLGFYVAIGYVAFKIGRRAAANSHHHVEKITSMFKNYYY